MDASVALSPIRVHDLNEQRVAPSQHVTDDPGGPDQVRRVVLIKYDLCVSGTDVQDPDLSHLGSPLVVGFNFSVDRSL